MQVEMNFGMFLEVATCDYFSYLLLGLEDIAAEDIALSISGDVAENLQILRVVGHVEYPKDEMK